MESLGASKLKYGFVIGSAYRASGGRPRTFELRRRRHAHVISAHPKPDLLEEEAHVDRAGASRCKGSPLMLDPTTRYQLSDELLRRFGASLRGIQLYAPSHPIVARNLEALGEALRTLHQHEPVVVIGILAGEMIVGDLPMTKAADDGRISSSVRSLESTITIDGK